MRILHLTRDFPPRHCGGISTAVGGLVEALKRSDVECAVVSFDDYRPADARRSGISRAKPARDRRSDVLRVDDDDDLGQLPRFARDFAPDLIQLHVDLLWDVAADIRELLGVPLVHTLHVCHRRMLRTLDADKASASLAAQERALAQADRVVAPTRAAAAAILEDYPQTADRLDLAGFTVDPAPPADLAVPRLVTVGRFGAVKGTDRLIDLLPHVLEAPHVIVEVVGGLPRNPRRERRWRRRIVEAAGLHADRVRVHGWLEPARRDRVLSTARALLSVSRSETFGLAVLEALAHGVPVCGYETPALVETAPDQVWLAEAEPYRVAAAVRALLADRSRCLELGRVGRGTLRPWSTIVDEWRAVYAVARDRRPGA